MADNIADNVELNAASGGAVIATDDAGVAGHVQVVKLAVSADGSATAIPADGTGLDVDVKAVIPGTAATNLGKAEDAAHASGDVGVMAMAVRDDALAAHSGTDGDYEPLHTDANGALWVIPSGTVTVDGSGVTQPVSHATLGNAHSSDFDTGAGTDTTPSFGIAVAANGGAAVITGDATNGLDVDVTRVTGTVTVDGSGVTQPVSHAALTELAAAIDTELQVDVVGALPAGTNNIGDVDIASIAAGDNNIGNVDVVSSIPGTGATNLGKAEDAVHGTGDTGVYVLAVRDDSLAAHSGTDGDYESLHTDASGALWVKPSGTVTVDGSGVTQPVSHAALTELAAAIDTEVQVDVVGALPAGTNAIGKLAANSGVDIGDVDVLSVVPGTGATNLGKAEDGAHTTGDTGVMALGVRVDTPNTALSGTDADYTPIAVNKLGSVRVAPPEDDFAVAGSNHVKKYYTNAGAVTDGIVWSPAAGKRWYVTDLIINVSAAATVTLEDDLVAGDSAVMKFELAANSGITHSFNTPLFSGEDAADLLVTTSAGNIYITITGYEI